jgi:hydroxymethylpyrimidine pyrophosphatase-like HAD family hydrolase
VTDKGKSVQFAGKDISKLSSIKRVQAMMNFTDEEICVFGDDVNDLEMISYFEHSVAMGNGADAVREKAGFVTKGNDENGIAFAIENYVLNGEENG